MIKTLNKISLITALFFTSFSSYSSMELWEGDREKSKTVSLISGKSLEYFHSNNGQAAITLGFRPLEKNPNVHHAYIVFETAHKINGKQSIKIQGIHLGTKNNSKYDPDSVYGYVYGSNDAMIYIESDGDVLKKFFRAKKVVHTEVYKEFSNIPEERIGYKEILAPYQKSHTFLVKNKDALDAIEKVKEDKKNEKIKFDIKGFSFLPKWLKSDVYNCTSYAARVLRYANICIPNLKGFLFYDRDSLVNAVKEYIPIRWNVNIITPPSAQQLKTEIGDGISMDVADYDVQEESSRCVIL